MALVDQDDVVGTLTANGADQAFGVRILPACASGGGQCLDVEGAHPAPEPLAVDGFAIEQEVPWRVPGKGLDERLRRPPGGRVRSDVAVHQVSAIMTQHNQHGQNTETSVWSCV